MNANNDIEFTSVQFDGDSGNNARCFTPAFFSADYGPQVDTRNGNAKVFTN